MFLERVKHWFHSRGAKARRTGFRAAVTLVFRWTIYVLLGLYGLCVLSLVLLRYVNPPFTAMHVERRLESLVTGRDYEKHYRFVPLRDISPNLQHAVIAAEDGRFYEHSGIDWQELRKVARESRKRVRGGSTITQQLAKNLFLTARRSILRKGLEFTLAPVVELILPKKRILEIYLNVIEWGPGVYGAEEAARRYYRTSAARLSREQSARLAAVIPNPQKRRPQNMHSYAAQILDRMTSQGW